MPPDLTSAEDTGAADPDRRTVKVTVVSQGRDGPIAVNFGDGTIITVTTTPWTASHKYATAGVKSITGTSTLDTTKSTTIPATVPYT